MTTEFNNVEITGDFDQDSLGEVGKSTNLTGMYFKTFFKFNFLKVTFHFQLLQNISYVSSVVQFWVGQKVCLGFSLHLMEKPVLANPIHP